MSKINFEIDGKKVSGNKGQTIYEVAKKNNIEIPTLCHDDRLKPYGSCWVCLVEIEGGRGFVPSCSYEISEGLIVRTKNEAIKNARKMALELLLSNHFGDCVAPCQLQCPANVDVQGFIALISEQKYAQASKLHKEKNPFPLVCGRVCPRTCENECRRNIVDEPVAIAYLKRFFADKDLEDKCGFKPVAGKPTEKKVAIIGGGPAGLSAAYYLAEFGHSCDVFEALPKTGGMLRYGIPSYRLPRDILEKEIKYITDMGVNVFTNKKLGKDIELSKLKKDYDSVLLAFGAHVGSSMRCKGEDKEGVVNGIEFLRQVSENEKMSLKGKKVAVVGGGNTAIDASRTALRLGAEKVIIVYRRTKEQMPAWDLEVNAAIEEGVETRFLAAPTEVISESGKIKYLKCNEMKLGEPDSSGRRRPIPVPDSNIMIEVDMIIPAIGQKPDISCIENENINVTSWRTIDANMETGRTNIENIFAAGDVLTGAATAVEAIAGGRQAALSIHNYLIENKNYVPEKKFNIKKDMFRELTKEDFKHIQEIKRTVMPELEAEERSTNFIEVEKGLSDNKALEEASRCLECGCNDVFECKLREYSTDYQVHAENFLGSLIEHPIDSSHPYIVRDPNKCIACARCIRTCMEIKGIGALGFVYRGFNVEVSPAMKKCLENTSCDNCGQCISACPTGALKAKVPYKKPGPWDTEKFETVCDKCSMLCNVETSVNNNMIVSIKGAKKGSYIENICEKGSFSNFKIPEINLNNNLVLKIKEKIHNSKNGSVIAGVGVSCEDALKINEISQKLFNKKALYIDNNSHIRKNKFKNLDEIRKDNIIVISYLEEKNELPILTSYLRTLKIQKKKISILGKILIDINDIDHELSDLKTKKETADKIEKFIKKELQENSNWTKTLKNKPSFIIDEDMATENIIKLCSSLTDNIVVLNKSFNVKGLEEAELSSISVDKIQDIIDNSDIILHFGKPEVKLNGNSILFSYEKVENKENVIYLNSSFEKSNTYFSADNRKICSFNCIGKEDINTKIFSKLLK